MAYSALYTGISGLSSFSRALGIIGDNIANMNTPGFKSARAQFGTLLAQRTGNSNTQANQVGNGTMLIGVGTNLGQGIFFPTQRDTDMAIEGAGYFAVRDAGGRQLYTRSGQFGFDDAGRLVDPLGNTVVGFQAQDGTVTNALGDITFRSDLGAPEATTAVDLRLNLDADAAGGLVFDPADPANTSDFSTSVDVFDSLGARHSLDLYFVKTAPNTWEVHVMVPNEEVGVAGDGFTEVSGAGETITFDAAGALDTEPTFAAGGAPLAIAWANGALPGAVTIDFGESITGDGGDGLGGATQFSETSTFLSSEQDGAGVGLPVGFDLEPDGTITALLSNGDTEVLGRIALANFQNAAGLERIGSNLFAETAASNTAVIGTGGTTGFGLIRNFGLEQSNVDLASEFVSMITSQRGFQANSRVIATNSDLLAQLVNIV